MAIPTTHTQLPRTMSEAIARTLREQILQGEIAPGSRLHQEMRRRTQAVGKRWMCFMVEVSANRSTFGNGETLET